MDKMIKGTETEKSLLKAFAGESQAKNRYTFFSEIAKKEGYEQIAGIFYETALQEEMHAKRFFSYLEGGMLEITAAYPAGALLDTLANLAEAADGEPPASYLRLLTVNEAGEPVIPDGLTLTEVGTGDTLACYDRVDARTEIITKYTG